MLVTVTEFPRPLKLALPRFGAPYWLDGAAPKLFLACGGKYELRGGSAKTTASKKVEAITNY